MQGPFAIRPCGRPGVRVLYRHGYYARDQLVPFDRQQFLTHSRIATAGYDAEDISDIGVTLKAGPTPRPGGEIDVELTIDTSRVRFTTVGGLRVATVQLALFAGDRRQEVVGELWQTLELKFCGPEIRGGICGGIPRRGAVVCYSGAAARQGCRLRPRRRQPWQQPADDQVRGGMPLTSRVEQRGPGSEDQEIVISMLLTS